MELLLSYKSLNGLHNSSYMYFVSARIDPWHCMTLNQLILIHRAYFLCLIVLVVLCLLGCK